MSFEKEIKDLLEKKEYDSVIAKLYGEIDDIEEYPHLMLYGAEAFNCLAEDGLEDYYFDALSLLEDIREVYENNIKWNELMVQSFLGLKAYGKAVEYLEKLIKFNPKNQQYKNSYKQYIDIASLPKNIKTLKARVSSLITEFKENEMEIVENFQIDDFDAVTDSFNYLFREIFYKLQLEIEEKTFGEYKVYIQPYGNKWDMYTDAYIKQLFEIEKFHYKWNLCIGKPSQYINGDILFNEEDIVISSESIMLWLSKTDSGLVDIFFYYDFNDFNEEQADIIKVKLQNRLELIITEALGNIARLMYISDIKLLDYPYYKNTPSISINQLASRMRDMGYELSVNINQLLKNNCEYTEKPLLLFGDNVDIPLRSDIVYGNSIYPELIEEYDIHSAKIVNDMELIGAVAGFFFIPIKALSNLHNYNEYLEDYYDTAQHIFDSVNQWLEQLDNNCNILASISSKNEDENMSAKLFSAYNKICDDYLKRLYTGIGFKNIMPIGHAIGKSYLYIDFISWDYDSLLDNIFYVFKDLIDICQVGIKTFRYNSLPFFIEK